MRGRDVSDRKPAQGSAGDAHARYVALVEHMPAVIYVFSVERRRLEYISPQVQDLLGYPPERWLQDSRLWRSAVHTEDRRYVFSARERSRRTGEPFNAEYRLRARDQKLIWIHDRALVLRGEDGSLRQLQGAIFDITERKRIEVALAASESRYWTLVETSPDAILVIDPRGQVLMANRQAALLLDEPAVSGLNGRQSLDLVVAEDRQWVRAAIEVACSQGSAPTQECTVVGAQGRQIPVELSLAAIADGEGPAEAILAVVRDIRERRRADEALRESQAKSRFLATMSHELRTPLNSILGFAQLLSGGQFGRLSPRQERYVAHIHSSGSHLLQLVNDVLDVATVTGGQLRLQLQTVPLEPVVRAALERSMPAAEAKRIGLQASLAPALVRADASRLEQVVVKLLDNAVKFTPPEGTVRVSSRCRGGRVELSVRDTGIGIPSGEQGRIFETFEQLDGGRTRHQEGTGVGLALTRQLVTLMDGSIEVRSEPGRGSTFTVSLPAAPAALSNPA